MGSPPCTTASRSLTATAPPRSSHLPPGLAACVGGDYVAVRGGRFEGLGGTVVDSVLDSAVNPLVDSVADSRGWAPLEQPGRHGAAHWRSPGSVSLLWLDRPMWWC